MNASKLKRLQAAGWKIGSTKDFLKRSAFVADALAAEKEVDRSGRTYPASPVHRYLRARSARMALETPPY
jgi:hypothetical protein